MVDKSLRQAEPFFSQPVRQIVMMLLVVALAGVGFYVAYPKLAAVFVENTYLNSFIALVFGIGVITCFLQVFQLIASVNWIEDFAAHRPGHELTKAPSLLAPLAALLRSRGARVQISSSSQRSILDSVATRTDESRDITRYLVNLLIFLGLLGTFFGLATTVPAVVDTIRSLTPEVGESGMQVFDRLMGGLETQLGGMGQAFSSSLLGLTGSLLVGMLELFAGHGQNRFYRELEEWLSTITRVGLATGEGEGGGGGDAGAFAQVLDHMADQMDSLQTMFVQSDVSRALVDERLGRLADAVDRLSQRLETESGSIAVLERMAEGQDRMAGGQDRMADGQDHMAEGQNHMAEGLNRMAEGQDRTAEGQDRMISALQSLAMPVAEAAEGGVDAESRMRLRSIDVQLLRILEEISAGRSESIAELRGDLAALTGAIRQMSRAQGAAAPRRE